MLSYQHSFHAGNMADVHKHMLLSAMLDYLTAKDKPLSYIETHAGRGLYRLDTADALKTGEAAAGIGRLADAIPPGHPYARCLAAIRARYGESAYPGSPLVAAHFLRPGDSLHLAELHPGEHAALVDAMAPYRARIVRQDGYEAAISICPPTPRRGLILIDPSYELKEEYTAIPRFIARIRRKWNVGIIALWYPILSTEPHLPMLDALGNLDRDALRHEVAFGPARSGHRMVGSGMFIINPPYGLQQEAAKVSAVFEGLSGLQPKTRMGKPAPGR